MTKRDFFIVIIKVFGLLSLVTSLFSALPGNISYAMMDFDALSIIWITITIIAVVGLFLILIFKSDKIVTLLKLDKGFDDDKIDLSNIRPADIIKISTFIIGGLLILNNLPEFLSHTLFAFKGDVIGMEYNTKDKFYWAMCGLNLVIGYLLLNNYEFVAKALKTEKD